jgi:hypothetical protein
MESATTTKEQPMIDPATARQLKEAGLEWQPAMRDHFMVPDSDLAKEIFTINDQSIVVQNVNGEFMIMFHGAAEWALDQVLVADLVWLPSEAQLREAIQQRLIGDGRGMALEWTPDGYRCTIQHLDQHQSFDAASAEDAYAAALLVLLNHERRFRGSRLVKSA